jgi:hypothetical protein
MPIERKNGFLEFHDLGITPSLGLESSRLADCIAEVQRREWRGVFGNPGFGFRESDLDFLEALPELEQVWLWDGQLKDIEGLYALRDLRYLGIHPDRPGIDFSRFLSLETLVWAHNKHDPGVAELPMLRELFVWHFKPRAKSFDGLAIPQSVEQLEINWANPETLDGLPTLPRLRKLEFHRCRNLASLAGLDRIAPNLETLLIGSSGKVDIDSLPALPDTLRRVVINHQLIKE